MCSSASSCKGSCSEQIKAISGSAPAWPLCSMAPESGLIILPLDGPGPLLDRVDGTGGTGLGMGNIGRMASNVPDQAAPSRWWSCNRRAAVRFNMSRTLKSTQRKQRFGPLFCQKRCRPQCPRVHPFPRDLHAPALIWLFIRESQFLYLVVKSPDDPAPSHIHRFCLESTV